MFKSSYDGQLHPLRHASSLSPLSSIPHLNAHRAIFGTVPPHLFLEHNAQVVVVYTRHRFVIFEICFHVRPGGLRSHHRDAADARELSRFPTSPIVSCRKQRMLVES